MITTGLGRLMEIGFALGASWSVGTCAGSLIRYIAKIVTGEEPK